MLNSHGTDQCQVQHKRINSLQKTIFLSDCRKSCWINSNLRWSSSWCVSMVTIFWDLQVRHSCIQQTWNNNNVTWYSSKDGNSRVWKWCESVIWPAINCAIHFVLLLKMSFFVFASNIKNSKWIGIVLNVSFFFRCKASCKILAKLSNNGSAKF